jgi:beta-1,4-mannosyltransferase
VEPLTAVPVIHENRRTVGTSRPLIAAVQFPRRASVNPYVDILRDSLLRHEFTFGCPVCFTSKQRIALLHWTENYWLTSESSRRLRIKRFILRQQLLLSLRLLRAQGFKLIWFAHNSTPHEWGGSEAEWYARASPFFRHIDAVAHLTAASTRLAVFDRFKHLAQVVVPHPHYGLVDPSIHTRHAGRITRLLMLGGASQPRKNAYAALQSIQAIPHLRTIVTGDADGPLARSFQGFAYVDVMRGILDEQSLFALFDGSTAVLLNQPRQLNSGCMLLGLSRGAPVICPDTPTNREMQSLVGAQWIRLFKHPLSSEQLVALIREPIPTELPNLRYFRPELVGRSLRAWIAERHDSSDRSWS